MSRTICLTLLGFLFPAVLPAEVRALHFHVGSEASVGYGTGLTLDARDGVVIVNKRSPAMAGLDLSVSSPRDTHRAGPSVSWWPTDVPESPKSRPIALFSPQLCGILTPCARGDAQPLTSNICVRTTNHTHGKQSAWRVRQKQTVAGHPGYASAGCTAGQDSQPCMTSWRQQPPKRTQDPVGRRTVPL